MPLKKRLLWSSGPAASPRWSANFSGRGLAGRRRLGDEQIARGEHTAVGRDHVAGGQRDQITSHQIAQRNLCRLCSLSLSGSSRAGFAAEAVLRTIAFRLSAARCERPSCTKRMSVLSITMAPMTIVALASAPSYDTTASTVGSRSKGFW